MLFVNLCFMKNVKGFHPSNFPCLGNLKNLKHLLNGYVVHVEK